MNNTNPRFALQTLTASDLETLKKHSDEQFSFWHSMNVPYASKVAMYYAQISELIETELHNRLASLFGPLPITDDDLKTVKKKKSRDAEVKEILEATEARTKQNYESKSLIN